MYKGYVGTVYTLYIFREKRCNKFPFVIFLYCYCYDLSNFMIFFTLDIVGKISIQTFIYLSWGGGGVERWDYVESTVMFFFISRVP